MNSQELALYQKIKAFALDKSNVSFSYSQRLARDNQWSLNYTQRVIEEYKKFLFLAIAAGHPVTPSVTVDEAWHLHLTYTHSYWQELCGQVLKKPLHHHPTQGGSQQRQFFWNCYTETLDSYEQFFGYRPPVDIWPSSTLQFSQAEQLKPISDQDYWVIPKPSFQRFTQRFSSIPQLSWFSVIIIALLTLSLVLIGSFLSHQAIAISAVTQASSDSSITSEPSNTIQHLFSILCIVFSLISFILGVILSLQPIFVHPIGKTKVIGSSVDSSVRDTLKISSLLLLLFVIISLFLPRLTSGVGVFSLFFWVILAVFIYTLEIKLIRYLTGKKGQSLRPLYCIHCRQKLKMLDSPINVLNEKEQTAMQIKSTIFEAWQCEKCYPNINRQSIHLQVYRKSSHWFKMCPDCREVTMTRTSTKILQEATTKTEGRALVNYTCHYCYRKKEETEIIPKVIENCVCGS